MTLLSQGRESVVSPAALPSTGSMACIKAEAGFLGSAKAGSPIIVMKSGEVVGMIKRAGEWTLLGLGGVDEEMGGEGVAAGVISDPTNARALYQGDPYQPLVVDVDDLISLNGDNPCRPIRMSNFALDLPLLQYLSEHTGKQLIGIHALKRLVEELVNTEKRLERARKAGKAALAGGVASALLKPRAYEHQNNR